MSEPRGTRTGHQCPFCGSTDTWPEDSDGWACLSCKRSHPTNACKCKHPDCWEYALFEPFCELHRPPLSPKRG